MSIPVSIMGATGYTGGELVRLLDEHPHFHIAHLTAHSQAGKKVSESLPGIAGKTGAMVLASTDSVCPDHVQLVFTALPHGAAAQHVKKALDAGKRVVDLSADFRHGDQNIFKTAYHLDHPHPELLHEAIYGLTEFAKGQLLTARLVANPGCYPSSVLLPLIPLLRADVVDANRIIADSKSGTSGAGRSAKTELLYCEVNENVRAYGLPRHRHVWEMEEQAGCWGGKKTNIQFVPHIMPMTRGMLTTLYLHGDKPESWHDILCEAFPHQPFVQILPQGDLPSTGGVSGSNRCDIGIAVTGKHDAVVVSCLDNLLKGAAGQAVQNANVMFGYDETTGLHIHAAWP